MADLGNQLEDVGFFAVQIKIVCEDQKGRLKEITECFAGGDINITSVDAKVKDGVGISLFVIKVNNLRQLDRVIRRLTKLDGIDYVERTGR